MAVKLHRAGLEHAGKLVREGRFVNDDRDAWSEHQPSAAEENQFIRRYGFAQFGRWHLGIDDEKPENTKGRYKFPYGYSSRALASWARRIRAWDADGRDVYVYFDNDVKVKAPFDALTLMRTGGNPAWEKPGRR